jgi:hypothetical protein
MLPVEPERREDLQFARFPPQAAIYIKAR